jgi:RNA polymerase sigma factor (sigma-70 family)
MNTSQLSSDAKTAARSRRFEALYAEHYARVLGYVLRRTETADDAADVIAETFLVAWRRLDDAPTGDRARLWLYGVARRALANHRRGQRRRGQLAARLRDDLAARCPIDQQSGEITGLAVAFLSLPDGDREILALHGWEALDAGEIAIVLGCSRNAARIRLHRARRRLEAAMRAAQDPAGGGAPESSDVGRSARQMRAAPRNRNGAAAGAPRGRGDDPILTKGDI